MERAVTDLSEAIRVRVPLKLRDRLDRIEARERGKGRRDVNRSSLIRDAIEAYVEAQELEER